MCCPYGYGAALAEGSVFEALIRSWTEMRFTVVSVCCSVMWGSNEMVDGEQSSLARYSTRSSGGLRRGPISETEQIGDNIN